MAHMLDPYRDRIIELAQQKLSAAKIAVELEVTTTRNTIISYCHRNGIPLGQLNGNRRNSLEDRFARLDGHEEEIVARIENSQHKRRCIIALSARFDTSENTIRAWLRSKGLLPEPKTPTPPKMAFSIRDFVPPPVEGIPFLDAGPDNCRYPLWGLEDKIGNVCGRQVAEKIVKGEVRRLSWCPECLTRVSAGRVAEAA